MDGYFDSSVTEEGLEEMMLFHEGGGSLAAFALTRCGGFYSSAMESIFSLLNSITNKKCNTIGDAILNAKRDIILRFSDNESVIGPAVMYTLLGDPALSLPTETKTETKKEFNKVSKPISFNLNCYPNPFNRLTTIEYNLPKPVFITLKIYNISGHEIATLVNSSQNTGQHKIIWEAESLPSGIYFYRLQAGEFSETKKLILQK